MRTLKIAALLSLTLAVTVPANAQRLGRGQQGAQGYPGRTTLQQAPRTQRWGGTINGRWSGGARAPGGWNAYRRPVRGFQLPHYWIAPSFYINDFASYGLAPPPYGYSWNRYYDDAVLVDTRGQVSDWVDGVDWDGYGDAGSAYAGGGAGGAGGGYYGGNGQPGYPGASYGRRDDGVGGAVAGAIVGGIAGSAIAGRGNRLGGALIGAGVGAGVGYAIDRSEDRGRYDDRGGYDVPPPPAYGTSYQYQQGGQAYAPPPPPPIVQQQGSTTTYSSSGGYVAQGGYGGGYASGGYWYPAPTVTTITVQSVPVIETTTTEYITESTSYAPVRRVYRAKRKWRPAVRRSCTCSCGCR